MSQPFELRLFEKLPFFFLDVDFDGEEDRILNYSIDLVSHNQIGKNYYG